MERYKRIQSVRPLESKNCGDKTLISELLCRPLVKKRELNLPNTESLSCIFMKLCNFTNKTFWMLTNLNALGLGSCWVGGIEGELQSESSCTSG